MGYLKEKYENKDYYLGYQNENFPGIILGNTLQKDSNGNFVLRDFDKNLLDKINFENKRVLEIGFGRGEAAIYADEKKAAYYVGCDFSQTAYNIAIESFRGEHLHPDFICSDAVEFLQNLNEKIVSGEEKLFDIAIMLDVIEHIPRHDLSQILPLLNNCLKEKGIFVINTPVYNFDNDIVSQGYDKRNDEGWLELCEKIEECQGMHCNKYTIPSLQKYLKEFHFDNISLCHYFIKENTSMPQKQSYKQRWDFCKNTGYPLLAEYTRDLYEYPYEQNISTNVYTINSGEKSFNLILSEDYYNNYYKNQTYDIEVLNEFKKLAADRDVVIFDVGVFMGVSSLEFAKNSTENSKIIGFEANPYNCCRTFENLSLNPDLAKKIYIEEIGLSNFSTEIEMFMSSNIDVGYASTSRLNGTHAKINNENLPAGFFNQTVKIISLDEYIENTHATGGGGIPDIIKVDIEGAEHLFLEGAINLLQTKKPVLFIEFHSEFCTLKCSRILFELGYDIQVLKEDDDNRIMVKAVYNNYNDNEQDFRNQILYSKLRSLELNNQIMTSKLLNIIDGFEKIIDDKTSNVENNLRKFMLTNKYINFGLFLKLLPVNLIPVKSWRKKLRNKIIKKEEQNV